MIHIIGSLRGGGGGGGVHPDFFVKLDFEIAVDQQTSALDRGCPLVPAGQPRPYLVNSEIFRANFGIWLPNFFVDLNQKSAS